jgi:hypothetical protein
MVNVIPFSKNQADIAVVGSKPTTTTLTAAIERGKAAQRELDRAAAQTWDKWRAICLALLAIQNLAMAAAKAEQPRGAPYHRAVNHRLRLHGFERYDKAARSRMVEVARDIAAIDAWRATLPAERLIDLNYPRTVLTAWKQALRSKPDDRSEDRRGDKPDSQTSLDAALCASSGWDTEVWKAVLAAKGLDWFRRVMPADWRSQLQRLAGGQVIERLKASHPDMRVKRLKRRHLELVRDAAEAPTTH